MDARWVDADCTDTWGEPSTLPMSSSQISFMAFLEEAMNDRLIHIGFCISKRVSDQWLIGCCSTALGK